MCYHGLTCLIFFYNFIGCFFRFSRGGIRWLGSCVGISAGAWAHSGWFPLWEPVRRQFPDALCLHPTAPQHWVHSSQWEEDSGANQHMDQSGLSQVRLLLHSFVWLVKFSLVCQHVSSVSALFMLWSVMCVQWSRWWSEAVSVVAQSAEPVSGAAAAAVRPDWSVRSCHGSVEVTNQAASAGRGKTELRAIRSYRPGQEISCY